MSNVQLRDIAEIIMGQSPKGEDVNTKRKGFPLLNGPTEFTSRYPQPTQYTTNGKRFSQVGDIIFCVRGSTTGRMNYADQEYAVGRGIGAIRGINGFPTPFVRAVIETNLERLLQAATGSTFPNLSRDTLNNFEIKCVTSDEATKINQFIVSLEDKIYINQQINQTLEAMAQALFKSWFVDFEPVKAKIAALETGGSEEDANLAAMQAISGKTLTELQQLQTENPDHYQQLHTTAQHFPAAMQDSELGEIPEGWEVKKFGDYLDSISKTYPLKSVDKVVFLNTGDIQNGQFLVDDYVSSIGLPGQAKKSIQKNDILYSEIRPINRRFAYVHFEAEEYVVSTKLMVLRSNEKIPSEVLCFLLTRQPIIDELQIAAESRSGTFPQIRFENVANTEFVGPSDNVLFSEFNRSYLHNYFSIQNNNIVESKQLEKLRDILLPKLLSGELSVADVDQAELA